MVFHSLYMVSLLQKKQKQVYGISKTEKLAFYIYMVFKRKREKLYISYLCFKRDRSKYMLSLLRKKQKQVYGISKTDWKRKNDQEETSLTDPKCSSTLEKEK